MIINKSFKYDSDKCPKVHNWVTKQDNFSESVRQLIEKECGEVDPVVKALQEIRQQIAGLRLSGPVNPQQEANLIQIDEAVQELQEKTEIKAVNPIQLKNRYGI
jgi:hypothetical protein